MKNQSPKGIHEEYHKKTKSQYKIILENNFTYRFVISTINKYLRPGMKILDIGCGAGTLDFYFANQGFRISGIDISKKAIQSCTDTSRNLGLKNVDFKQGYFPDEKTKGKFDFVIFSEVIEHLEDDQLALREIHKLLNPGGILFLSTPSVNAPLHRLGLTKKFDKEVGHLRRYDLKGLSKMVKDNGFRIIEVKKTEGIVRNFLFTNPIAGKFIRFIKFFLSDIVTYADNLTVPIFGESDIIIIAKKVETE